MMRRKTDEKDTNMMSMSSHFLAMKWVVRGEQSYKKLLTMSCPLISSLLSNPSWDEHDVGHAFENENEMNLS